MHCLLLFYTLQVFHNSLPWRFFIEVRVTASLLKLHPSILADRGSARV